MLHNRQPGLDKKPLHHILVHAHRRTQHAGADIRDPSQLKQSLNRAVFAEGPMQHGEDNVESLACRALRSRSRRQQRRHALLQQLCPRRGMRVSRPQSPCNRTLVALKETRRVSGGQPAALFGDADRRHVKLLAIDCLQN